MKHCLIITAYKDLNQIKNLVRNTPQCWGCFIHIDKKSSINKDDIENIDDRVFVLKRYNINWGSVNHLRAFLDLLNIAITSEKEYDYFHLITGQDYFATNPAEFNKLIEKGKSYIETHKCPRPGWWGGGYDILKYRSLATNHEVQRKKMWKLVEIMYYNFQKVFHLQRALPSYPLFCGSVYCSLYKDDVLMLRDSQVSKDLLSRIKKSKCAEEIFIQTVLMNSPRKKFIITNNLRYIDWAVKSPPKFLDEEDFNKIVNSKKLFCRKIDSRISGKLVKMLNSAFQKNFSTNFD